MAGVLLMDFLAVSYPSVDRAALRGLQAEGRVYVNGMPAAPQARLSPFDYVEVRAAESELVLHRGRGEPEEPSLRVLVETAHVLVLDKPAGETVVPDRSGEDAGIHGMLPALRPGQDLRIVHRLDRDTSGCLVLGKGLEAARHLDAQFRERKVEKTYLALVHGAMSREECDVESFLGPDPRRPGKVVSSPRMRDGFKPARTRVSVEQAFARHTLTRLMPETGRSHQLRVHLQSIGHPIVGDADYGGEPLLLSQLKRGYKLRPGMQERPLLERMFLHACSVAFDDVDGARVEANAPLPEDLQRALDKVTNFGAARMRRE
jgi:23S rRNA pseudouridine955/2504/2580 synthase